MMGLARMRRAHLMTWVRYQRRSQVCAIYRLCQRYAHLGGVK